MNKSTIDHLKNNGYKVKINHYRPFITYWDNPNINCDRKRERVVYLPAYHTRNKQYKLISRGDYTTIAIYKDSRLIEESLAICSNNDVFSYQKGVKESFDKMEMIKSI